MDKLSLKTLLALSALAVLDWTEYGVAKLGCAARRRHEWVALQAGSGYIVGHHCLHCGRYDEDMT